MGNEASRLSPEEALEIVDSANRSALKYAIPPRWVGALLAFSYIFIFVGSIILPVWVVLLYVGILVVFMQLRRKAIRVFLSKENMTVPLVGTLLIVLNILANTVLHNYFGFDRHQIATGFSCGIFFYITFEYHRRKLIAQSKAV